MQALSQLSYGPTMLEAEFYACALHSPSLFSDTTLKKKPDRDSDRVKQNAPAKTGAFCVSIGVPTGIRTPVATVKG